MLLFARMRRVISRLQKPGQSSVQIDTQQLAMLDPGHFQVAKGGSIQRSGSMSDPTLLKLLRRAHNWRRQLETGRPQSIADLAVSNSVNASYFTRVLRLAYLAPDIVKAIVSGRQPTELTANRLVRMHELPIDWPSQRQYFGFPAA